MEKKRRHEGRGQEEGKGQGRAVDKGKEHKGGRRERGTIERGRKLGMKRRSDDEGKLLASTFGSQ